MHSQEVVNITESMVQNGTSQSQHNHKSASSQWNRKRANFRELNFSTQPLPVWKWRSWHWHKVS